METLISRYRNVTVLLLVIFAQLILLAYQVKNDSDVRLIRVWAVTAVTPVARAIETVRGGTTGFVQNYIVLHDTHAENERMRSELGRLKIENQFLKAELSTADRAKALAVFESHSPSKMLAARVIATATGASAGAVFVDRGSTAGVEKGMGVVTPDGIVGKVLAAYPTASQVLLVTDPSFAAGVVSQKNHVHGILKGSGHNNCRVDYVPNEEKIENGEQFYTSGDDRIFPRGLPAGQVTGARSGNQFQEITVEPSAVTGGLEEVLIILQGVHEAIPDMKTAAQPVYLGQPPPGPQGDEAGSSAQTTSTGGASKTPALATDADKLLEHYKDLGQAQGHKFGDNPPGAKAVDFNAQVKPGEKPAARPKSPAGGAAGTAGQAVTAAPKPAQASPGPQAPPEASPAGKPAPNPPQ